MWANLGARGLTMPGTNSTMATMLPMIIIAGFLVAALGAVVVIWRLRKRPQGKESEVTFFGVVNAAKQALQGNKPALYAITRGGDRVAFNPQTDHVDPPPRLRKFHLATGDLGIDYVVEEYVEEVVIALMDHDEKVTLSFAEGELNGAWMGTEALAQESFELRQGRGAASNLRRLLRHHLGLPGGELDDEGEAPPRAVAKPRKKKRRAED